MIQTMKILACQEVFRPDRPPPRGCGPPHRGAPTGVHVVDSVSVGDVPLNAQGAIVVAAVQAANDALTASP